MKRIKKISRSTYSVLDLIKRKMNEKKKRKSALRVHGAISKTKPRLPAGGDKVRMEEKVSRKREWWFVFYTLWQPTITRRKVKLYVMCIQHWHIIDGWNWSALGVSKQWRRSQSVVRLWALF